MFGEGEVACIHSDLTPEEMDAQMHHIRNGKPKLLINVEMATESISLPEYSVSLMLRPTMSPRLVEQSGSRSDRKDRNNPDKISMVVQFLDENMPQALMFGNVVGKFHVFPKHRESELLINPQPQKLVKTLAELDPDHSHNLKVLMGVAKHMGPHEVEIVTRLVGKFEEKGKAFSYEQEVQINKR